VGGKVVREDLSTSTEKEREIFLSPFVNQVLASEFPDCDILHS
jgi:hypothetical protein